MTSNSKSWNPAYIVKESARAKRVLLRLMPDCGLVLTVPKGFDRSRISQILADNRKWIERHLGEKALDESLGSPENLLPREIYFQANGECWRVRYSEWQDGRLRLTSDLDSREIEITGDTSGHANCSYLLKQWLRDQGQRILLPWLERLSAESGLQAAKVQIRTQKSRWGSYSTRGTLSLNAALLFLTAPEVRYVMIHELCHTVHHGHSMEFWKLVGRLEPNYRRLNLETGKADGRVPGWVRL
ncbi:M48 family metallopeptidase [Desulfoferrobacter suflitae]|uniref:M48 family metallopeptidase n=1 Tax=Desulfoferrobacter suflitae TaxID=2865782 RepID=UPI002164A12E|nr:SprT family zinc-dependent metalloprotease [Desulfoferrobacter suflitae]MCK8600134.1 M48 family metallopeptidase [Desulfoferrobacter suflitae]